MNPAEMFDPIWWLRSWMTDGWLRSKRAERYFVSCIVVTLALTLYMYTASYILYCLAVYRRQLAMSESQTLSS